MAVTNQLGVTQVNSVSKFMTDTGEIVLDYATVRNSLVNGNATVTDNEIMLFVELCKGQKLNPFMREVYLIKYSNNTPATMVVSKDAFQKRADKNPDYDGKKSGIIVFNNNTGEIIHREGTFYMKSIENVVGGWCEVFKKGRTYSERVEVSFDEYVGLKDGKPNSNWEKRPATMIRKVAVAQALREAFTSEYQGLYIAEEFGASDEELPTQEVVQEQVQELAPPVQEVQDDGFTVGGSIV